MTKEELIKNQFPNDEFLQSAILQIVDKCIAEFKKENEELRDNYEQFKAIAEPEIEKLQKENEELRNNGFTVSAMTERQLKVALKKGELLERENAELKKKLKEKLKTIADNDLSFVAKFDALEKENAELKSELTKKTDTNHSLVEQMADLESKNAELKEKLNFSTQYYQGEKAKDQLAKAKEIIKELVRVEYADFTNGDYSNELSKVLEQAEQFLKEIEK